MYHFNYCYSYRNFLLPKIHNNKDGDGFTIEINSYNCKFNIWITEDNSKSGFIFYSYAYQTSNSYDDFTYSHSDSWNNKNMDVFLEKMAVIMEEN